MLRQWEEFQVGPDSGRDVLRVTLSRKGEILVNKNVFEKLKRPDAAVLLFDRVNSVIGVMPSHMRNANAYPFNEKMHCTYRVVRANKFCRHYGIKVDRVIMFNRPEIDADGILVLDLKSTTFAGK